MALVAPVDIVIPSQSGPYFEPYDPGAGGDPYGYSSGVSGNIGGGGGGSSLPVDSSATTGGSSRVSSNTTRTGDTSLVTSTGDNVASDTVSKIQDAVAATPLQYLFNLALQRAAQPTGSQIVIPPTTGGGGSSLNIKTIVLIAVIGLGVWYVVRKYAKK